MRERPASKHERREQSVTEAPKDSPTRGKSRSDGEGSVYCRHKKDCPDRGKKRPRCKCPWQGAFVTHWVDGKPVRKKVSGPNKAVASNKLIELRDKHRANDLPAGTLTVETWMTYWYTRIAPNNTKPLTIAGYNAKVNQYIVPLLGHHQLERLTPEHIEDAWNVLRESGNPTLPEPKPLSANTIHQTHRILSAALKVAVQRKKLRLNPAASQSMKPPPKAEHELTPMTEAEVDKVLDACRGQWNAARWSVALALGLRQGEALGLRWEDVDLDQGVVHVRQTLMRLKGKGIVFGTPKSAAGRRSLALPASLHAALRKHRTEQTARRLELGNHWTDSGLVFTLDDGRPIDPSVDAGRWRRLLEDAGVRHYRLHDARHSAGTLMLSQGVDVRVAMTLLGHSQISVTMRYQHTVDAMKVDAATKLDQAGRWG